MLVDIPSSQITDFCNTILMKEWPHPIIVINFLKTCDKCRQQKKDFDVSLLYNNECVESGIFIGILRSGTIMPSICFHTLDKYKDMLEKELENLIVHLNGPFFFEGILEKHVPIVQKILARNSIHITMKINEMLVTCTANNAAKLQITCPPSVTIAPIKIENLPEMYSRWSMKTRYSLEEMETSLLMNRNSSFGIYCNCTGVLLCSAFRAHNGAICALETVPETRNKGYAKLLVKKLTKSLVSLGEQPYAFILANNTASLAVFHAAGYKEAYKIIKFIVNKK